MDVLERIKEQVEGNPIIIYMKGTPQFPQCGFSSRAAAALQDCGEHAEDWDDCLRRTFMEWKSGEFSEVQDAFDDLWAEIETMLEWEGKRHQYPNT